VRREAVAVAEKYADYMHRLVQRVVSEIGPRESCGDGEKQLGRLLVKEWEPLCDSVATEPFSCHPRAFLGFLPAYALLYLAAVACYWLFPLLSFLLAGLAFVTYVLELMLYWEFVDPLFPRQQGENIVGVIRPRGDVKRRVIVSAHTDSAYEFTLWYFLKNASMPIIVLGVLASLFLCVARRGCDRRGPVSRGGSLPVLAYLHARPGCNGRHGRRGGGGGTRQVPE
jgi:hypothetical protein